VGTSLPQKRQRIAASWICSAQKGQARTAEKATAVGAFKRTAALRRSARDWFTTRTSRLTSHPRALAGGLVLLATVALAAGVVLTRGMRHDGPLQNGPSSTRVSISAAEGEVVRFETTIPWNPTATDIHLRKVELLGLRNLDLVGVVLSYPMQRDDGTCLSAGYDRSFPPPGWITTTVLDGAVLPRADARTCTNYPTIVAGLRRTSGLSPGTLDAVGVVYEYRGEIFEVVLQQAFVVK
jgi:hypothetical protein